MSELLLAEELTVSLMLAIETSQHRGSVAVKLPDGRIDSESLSPKKRHDDDLLPAIDRLFARNNLKPRDLSDGAVAVSIGPGGFTGLRIAVATAKMFAETLGAKIIAVPSALVAAEGLAFPVTGLTTDDTDGADVGLPRTKCLESSSISVPSASSVVNPCPPSRSPSQILVALSAKNNTFWLTRVERINDHWQISPHHAPGIADAQSMPGVLAGVDVMLADEHFPIDARTRCEREGVPVIPPVFAATNCLAAGEGMLSRSEFTDPLQLLPLYPRQPEAVTIWQQRKRSER